MVVALSASRLLGLLRDTVISAQFGLNAHTDAYRAAFIIPDLLFFLLAGGALSSAFLPVFGRYWAEGKQDEAWSLFATVATLMGLSLLVLIGIAEVLAPALVPVFAPGLVREVIPETIAMSRILLPAQFAFFIGGLMFATMNARQHFLTPGLAPNVYNLGIILGALVLSSYVTPPIYGLAWGALLGAFIGNFFIPLFMMGRFGARYQLSFDLRHEGVRRVFQMMAPVLFGLSLPGIYAIAVRGFGSLHGEGAISALEIGNRIMQAPLGVFGQALAIAVFPTLVALHARNDPIQFLRTMSRTLRTSMFIGIYASVVLFVLAEDVVRVLNQYGRFTPENTQYVTACLRLYSIGVFAWCAHPVLMRAYFAMEDTLTPIILGSVATLFFLAFCFLFGMPPFPYEGLALGVSLSAIFLLVLMFLGLKWKLPTTDTPAILRSVSLSLLAGILTGGLMGIVAYAIPTPSGLAANAVSLLRLAILGTAGAWLYLGLGRLLRLEEAQFTLKALLRPSPNPVNPPDPSR
jgi:putative peptidoglycan lipid II flippase